MSLFEHNISLYSGDSFHDTPLMLHLFLNLKKLSPLLFPVVFVLADVLAALSLHSFSKTFISSQVLFYKENTATYAKDSKKLVPKEGRLKWMPDLICMLYMLNPFLIVTCVAQSTVVLNNMFLGLLFHHTVKGNSLQMTLFLALATYQTFYPVQLLAPVILCYHLTTGTSLRKSFAKITFLFLVWCSLLFGAASYDQESMFATFRFILTVPDLMPNVGIFWYFFTEVFDHFHTFFLCVFQLNVLIFSMPLTIKLRSRPVFLMFLLCYIIATFKSYPCLADAGFCLCLLPLWSHTFNHLRFPLVTGLMLIVSTILCPIMWNLWIHVGSANANFYFATTLVYCTSHVLIMTDMLVSYLKFDFHLHEGLKPKLPKSDKIALVRLMN